MCDVIEQVHGAVEEVLDYTLTSPYADGMFAGSPVELLYYDGVYVGYELTIKQSPQCVNGPNCQECKSAIGTRVRVYIDFPDIDTFGDSPNPFAELRKG